MSEVLLVKADPKNFIGKKGLVQIVGLPYTGKTIFANFLSTYTNEKCVWISSDDAYSFEMERRLEIPNDWRILIDVLGDLEKCGDIVVVVDPIFLYEAGEERNVFYEKLKGFTGNMLLIMVNKIIYDVKKRIGRNNEKYWGGTMLSVISDYIFRIRDWMKDESCMLDIVKSYKTPPIFGIELFFDNAILIKHSKIEKEI